MPLRAGGRLYPYALAFGFVVLAYFIKQISTPLFDPIPFTLFFGAIALSAWVGGCGPGTLATLLSTGIGRYMLAPAEVPPGPLDWIRLLFFLLVGLLISFLTAYLRSTERALIRSERRVRLTVDSSLDAVITMNAEGFISAWNREAERIFGWTEAEAIGRRLDETIIPENLRERHRAGLRRYLETGEGPILGRRIELPAVRRDGSTVPVELAVVAAEQDGELFFSGFVRDISDRQRMEKALRDSEEKFRAAFDFAGSGAALVEVPSGRLERVNPKFCEILGYEAEELQQMTFLDITHPEERERDRAGARRLWDGEIPVFSIDKRYVRKDGQVVWAQANVTLVPGSPGEPRRALAVVQDLSDLRRAKAALAATEEKFRVMADSAPVLVWIAGTDRQCSWFNRPWLEFTGRAMTQDLGSGWLECVHEDERPLVTQRYGEAFDRREPFEVEFRLRRFDGEYRWILSHGVPLLGPGGEFEGYVGSCFDLTERKQAEEARERNLAAERTARSEAERANRLKDEFLATVSHELRTPLQAILGWSRLLREGRLDPESFERAAETIERNAALQAHLVEDLLDMSRIMMGKLRLDVQRVDLHAAILSAIEIVQPAADAKQIRLRTVLDPAADHVRGDPRRLQQVVWNLLANAIKFTPKDGKVEIVLERRDSNVQLAVSDTGEGIDPEFLPYVFDRFRQADASMGRKQGGLGLGLAIVRHLVELHGGTIEVFSSGRGTGTSFVLRLPVPVLGSAAGDGAEARAAATGGDLAPVSLQGVQVLLVEDDDDSRELLRHVLAEGGAEVQVATTADEALARLESATPHVIVSDIGLPGLDGYAFMERVRARPLERGGAVPAVALTAYARAEDRTRARLAGYQVHIAKPVEPLELMAAVANLAGLRVGDERPDGPA